MKVRFSKRASADLDAFLADLTARNPAAVQRAESRIRQVTERIGQYPDSFQERAERRGVRRVPLQRYPYLIFYKVIDREVGARREPWENL
jgi:plasmid stabilization system protein ParE